MYTHSHVHLFVYLLLSQEHPVYLYVQEKMKPGMPNDFLGYLLQNPIAHYHILHSVLT